tara:strand:- start:1426 stop:1893 length:468 start_codon:yes stop_codon:yes gene_type:complete
MPRRSYKKHLVDPDLEYNNTVVAKLINHIMRAGKKATARKVMYTTLDIVKEKSKKDPLDVLQAAMDNITPKIEVRSKRVGGATYQVPMEITPDRKNSLAFRWLLESARAKKGKPMAARLSEEILAAAKNEGNAVRKKEDTHRMAEANRAFAHFAR